jgi:hypothetical protein
MTSRLQASTLQPISSHAFGMHLVGVTGWDQDGTEPTNTPLHTFGCRSLRIWDTGAPWWRIESAKGVFDWSRLDAEMAVWSQGYDDVVYCLGQTPDWASGVVGEGWTRPAPPVDVQDAADFVTALLGRYPQITAIECWNEPENPTFYSGTVDQLAEITVAQAQAARAVRPAIRVVGACPQSFADRGAYLRQYLRAVRALDPNALDAVSVHTYVMPRQPEYMLRIILQLRQIAIQEGFGHLPMWSTEFGWGGIPGASEAGGFYDRVTGQHVYDFGSTMAQDQAAAYIARAYILSLSAGLARQYFYAADKAFSALRLIDFADKTRVLPAGQALTYVAGLLAGGRIGRVTQNGPLFRVQVRTAGGRIGEVLWCSDGQSVSVDLPRATEFRSVTGEDAGGVGTVRTVTDTPLFALT